MALINIWESKKKQKKTKKKKKYKETNPEIRKIIGKLIKMFNSKTDSE